MLGVEFALSEINSIASGSLSPAVLTFFTEPGCAPQLGTSHGDLQRSGLLPGGKSARLILKEITWTTQVGPSPHMSDTVRISQAKLQVFGTTIPVRRPRDVALEVAITYERPLRSSGPDFTFSTSAEAQSDQARRDCANHSLTVEEIDLGSSSWFGREGIFNLIVALDESWGG